MATFSLNRRKTQLELLAAACASRDRARVRRVGGPEAPPVAVTRFLALRDDDLLLDWPLGGLSQNVSSDALVDVHFEREQQRYAFRTRTRGRMIWTCGRRGVVPAWRLAAPLCVEPREQRTNPRVSLTNFGCITARFTNVADPQRMFAARLTNLATGGLGGIAPLSASRVARSGDLYWANFALPHESGPCEPVVRLVHVRANEGAGALSFGGIFCASDGVPAQGEQRTRIERFIFRSQGAALRRTRIFGAGGG